MAVSETAPLPRAQTRRRSAGAALARAWDARPDWARDRTVLALAGSLVVLLALFFLALGYLSADQPGRNLTLEPLRPLPEHGPAVPQSPAGQAGPRRAPGPGRHARAARRGRGRRRQDAQWAR